MVDDLYIQPDYVTFSLTSPSGDYSTYIYPLNEYMKFEEDFRGQGVNMNSLPQYIRVDLYVQDGNGEYKRSHTGYKYIPRGVYTLQRHS